MKITIELDEPEAQDIVDQVVHGLLTRMERDSAKLIDKALRDAITSKQPVGWIETQIGLAVQANQAKVLERVNSIAWDMVFKTVRGQIELAIEKAANPAPEANQCNPTY